MNICFLGHSSVLKPCELSIKLREVIENLTGGGTCTFYFGGYGEFDEMALAESKKVKRTLHRDIELIFMTPYITENYQRRLADIEKNYDAVVYPEIERVPYRFAISARNKCMIEASDVVIAYINRDFGGAYKSILHALRLKKKIINLGSYESFGITNYGGLTGAK